MKSHEQFCPVYQGRECDCNYIEPVASAGNALSESEIMNLACANVHCDWDEDEMLAFARAILVANKTYQGARAALASQNTPVAQEPVNYVIPKSVANAFTGKEREAWEHGFKWACSIIQPRAAAPTAAQGLSDATALTDKQIDSIASDNHMDKTWYENDPQRYWRMFARAILAAKETRQ